MKEKALKVTTPSDREITMTRVFDAPRAMVFDAFTKPELLKRWFGPEGWTLEVCEIELRPGGTYRYEMHKLDGKKMVIRGAYLEVVAPERIVHTETFDESWYEGDALVTSTFVERAGKTTLDTTVRYDSKAIRDHVLRFATEDGIASSYDRLAALLTAP
jgi:uncharacterized protein YndB with AHSA1/START domain